MSFFSHLQCSETGKEYRADQLINLSETGKPLLARYKIGDWSKDSLKDRPPTLWRYHEMLPVLDERYQFSLGEGFTPLIKADHLAAELGHNEIYIKDEGQNPTTSFKARGLVMAIAKAAELGAKAVSIPSAGNAAGAMSAYAALAGLKAYVYMPKDVPKPFIAECKALGAEVKLIDGLINDCGAAAKADNTDNSRFDVSTLKEPYRIEGKKTMGYELAEQLNWQLPDVIIYPTGGGTGLIGMWKAFAEMEELGWISGKRPRMVSVQSSGCAPIVRAFNQNKPSAELWTSAKTIADGLRVPVAIGDFLILQAIRESNGFAIAIDDSEMINYANMIGRSQGLFVSPEGAATLAAFVKMRDQQLIKADERVVLFNTGSGHKYSHLWF
ncbi:MAG: threonine synthase [Calditrichaeota bacterium]|nr:threonine synthase [Calditrichota bacterium]